MPNQLDPRLDQLLSQLEQAYRRKAWHGPGLKGTLSGVSVDQASWRPATKRHNIWELALHCAYWKYAAWRRFSGAGRGSFPLAGSNWFARPDSEQPTDRSTLEAWKEDLSLLHSSHLRLVEAVRDLDPSDLPRPSAKGSKTSLQDLLFGVAAHDIYHAGQVSMLKRLYSQSKTQ